MTDWQQNVREVALSWLRTPYHVMGQVKGPGGGVDCATLLIEVYSAAGLIPRFTPKWYSPQQPMHSAGEEYLKAILQYGQPVEPPWEVGDVLTFRLPGAPSCGHAGIYIGDDEIVHADWRNGVSRETLKRTLLRRTLAGGYRFRD